MNNSKGNFDALQKSFENKKIPILTLDTRWHELFPEYDKPDYIKGLEEQVNTLIKRQGKLTTDIKEIKALKKKLIHEIIERMDTDTLSTKAENEKKLEQNHKLIQEANEKIAEYDEELGRVPYLIKEANKNLMIESMSICYNQLQMNTKEIQQLEDWILKTREELKDKILMKQDIEKKNETMYTYMHDLLGVEVMEMFDQKED